MTCMDMVALMIRDTASKDFRGNRWGARHVEAFQAATGTPGAIAALVRDAAEYADGYRAAFGSDIGEDGVLGEEWARILRGIIGLLNGDCGQLDCGTLDSLLRDMARSQGYDEEL